MSEINFEQIKEIYINFEDLLENKKAALIKKDLDSLVSIDEKLICIYNQIKVISEQKDEINLSTGQKEELNKMSENIGQLQQDNEVLITHSLNVIEKIFEGILRITSSAKGDYNHMGKKNQGTNLDISSITEEA